LDVSSGALVRKQISQLYQRADTEQQRRQFLHAIREILKELEQNPTTWGDPLYRTHSYNGVVYRRLSFPILVYYVVFEKDRIVLINRIDPHPGSFLDTEPR